MAKNGLVYPELSYQLMGIMYKVHNEIGGGLKEKTYEDAVKIALSNAGLNFKQQLHMPVEFQKQKVGSRFFDFLVEDKIVVELKAGERFSNVYIKQISEYLRISGLKLGLLVNFGREEVKSKRVVNLDS